MLSTITTKNDVVQTTRLQLRLVLQLALLVLALVADTHIVDANSNNNNNVNNNNFRVVLDSPRGHDKKTRLMVKKKILQHHDTSSEVDIAAMVDRAKKEFHDVSMKTKELTMKLSEEAKELIHVVKNNLQHYSKKEIGFYAALTLALTFALKTVVFSDKAHSKTVDLSRISYILSSPAAMVGMYEPVKELRRDNQRRNKRRVMRIVVTPSVVSSDGKTYVRTVKKTLRASSSSTGSSIRRPNVSSSSSFLPPSRPAQVVVDTVTAFYQQEVQRMRSQQQDNNMNVVSPASHNAVIQTMSPAMRRSLKARRIRGGAGSNSLLHRLEVGLYFALWYALNIVYNIINKKVLNVLPAPMIVGTAQFGIGAVYCGLVWLLKIRPRPTLTPTGRGPVAKVGAYHALGQLSSMVSLGAGPVSFTHIVKALEPFFSAIVSGLYLQEWMPVQVYLTLIPVVCGVGYACMKEVNFTWLAFGAAMASNLFFAQRAVMSKMALQSGRAAGTNLSPPNMFGLVTWAAFIMSIPVALITEGGGFRALWSAAMDQVEVPAHFVRAVILSGLFHYLNNEVMYLALGSVHPVTLAVGNTMKRVFILVASVMVFRNPVSVQAAIGSGVGIAGVLLYSLTKQYYETLEKKQKVMTSDPPRKVVKAATVVSAKKWDGSVKKPPMKTLTTASTKNR